MGMPHEQPNILLIVADHQAWYGHHRPGEFEYELPRFEAFAREGIRFDRAHCVAPLCTPARASMMSGVYPSRHGMIHNNEDNIRRTLREFRPGQRLYNHHLDKAGYRNAYVGKWHCGLERSPMDYGFEGWSLPGYGKVYMSDEYRAYTEERGLGDARARIEHMLQFPEWEGETVVLHHESPWRFMSGSGVLEGPPEAHKEQFVAHMAVEKLKELAAGGRPFSLTASFWGPHQPYFPTEPYASMVDPESIPVYPSFDDDLSGRPFRHYIARDLNHGNPRAKWPDWSTWQQVLSRCYGQGYQLDAAVGTLLDALDETGLAENTLVIWCADHGDTVASHGGVWDKASTFTEEVARIPMAVRWPAEFEGGQKSDRLVSNMDVTATMLDAAGIAVPTDMDSRNMLPVCRDGETAGWPDQLICETHGRVDHIPQRIIYHDHYKYVAALFDGDEMYDLEADPYEMRNLINNPDYADIQKDLRARLIETLVSVDRFDPDVRRFLLALRSGLT
jgi:arylsulfatase A-like enzyme